MASASGMMVWCGWGGEMKRGLKSSAAAAVDRVIDFGKYKGKMLGSLPSAYLKWVSSNLRAGDTEEWARLADQVLADPVYRDRLEWEAAHNILTGARRSNSSSSSSSGVADLVEISSAFGWDNQDKAAWSKIDFSLLGTSKGGRIPRLTNKTTTTSSSSSTRTKDANAASAGGKRGERRERVRRQREMNNTNEISSSSSSSPSSSRGHTQASSPATPFPGREALFNKLIHPQNNT